MDFCPKCGTQIPEGTIACPKCQLNSNISDHAKSDDMKAIKKMLKKLYIIIPLTIILTVLITFVAAYFLFGSDEETVQSTKSNNVQATDNSFDIEASNSVCPEDEHGHHYWQSANCIEPSKCFNCGAYRNNQLGNHHWTNYDNSDEMFCTICYMLKSEYDSNL